MVIILLSDLQCKCMTVLWIQMCKVGDSVKFSLFHFVFLLKTLFELKSEIPLKGVKTAIFSPVR